MVDGSFYLLTISENKIHLPVITYCFMMRNDNVFLFGNIFIHTESVIDMQDSNQKTFSYSYKVMATKHRK